MRKLFAIAIIVICSFGVRAQSPSYKNLVMEGAGVKGFAYAGALKVLDSLHILEGIERVGGTSAGAIQAVLLAVGYTPEEIMTIASEIPLKQFNDGAWFFGSGLRRLHRQYGYYKGDKILDWIEMLIAQKTGNGDITFRELHELRPEKGYKDLYVTGTDLTWQRLVIFSHETFPDMCIKNAIRISLSIPFYYKPVLIDDDGKVYMEQTPGTALHVMVDGGLLSNYPLFLFDSTRYAFPDTTLANVYYENPETLGLIMEDPEQIAFNEKGPGNSPYTIASVKDYFKAIYHTLIDKANPDGRYPYTLYRTIAIDNLHLSGRVRKLPSKTIQSLMTCGGDGVRRYFASREGGAVSR